MNWEDHVRVSYDDNSELQKYFCVLNVQIYSHNHSVISLSFWLFFSKLFTSLNDISNQKISSKRKKMILSKNKTF